MANEQAVEEIRKKGGESWNDKVEKETERQSGAAVKDVLSN